MVKAGRVSPLICHLPFCHLSFGASLRRAFDELSQTVNAQLIQLAKSEVCVLQRLNWVGGSDRYHFHATAMSRLDPDQCILKHHALLRRYAQTTGGLQEHLGIRLAVRYIFGGDDNLKAISKADRGQTGFDVKAMC